MKRAMKKKRDRLAGVALCCALLSACDALPRDPAGTSRLIGERHAFSVALVDPSLRTAPQVVRLVKELEKRTQAHARWQAGTGEALLQRLDDGTLDLAIGHFRADSPWATQVAFAPALSISGRADAPMELKAAMRNGENRWIMTVERASRATSATARAQ